MARQADLQVTETMGADVTIEIRRLGPGDEDVLKNVAAEVFDNPVDLQLAAEFLRDEHHHLVVALEKDRVVGFASGISYVHPDKPLELWIDEVGVAPTHQRQGIGRQVMQALLEAGRAAGCHEAWVLTEHTNKAAMRLYESAGGIQDAGQTVMISFDLDA